MNALLGISLKIISTLAFTAMSTLIKLAGDAGYPTGQTVFFRSFFALIPLLAWLASRGELVDAVRTTRLFGHLKRSIAGTMAMFCGFTALSLLPLPDATAIGYATPLMTTLLAALVLKEVVRVYRWSALGVGFCGMLIMMIPYMQPGGAYGRREAIGALFGLGGAFFSGISSIEIRKLAQIEKTGAIVFYFSSTASVIGLSTIVLGWRMPGWHDGALLVMAGIAGGVGQILLTSSYRFAPASVIAPFDYTTLIWALIVGFVVFSNIPEPLVLTGAALVIAAGLFVIWRERQLGLEDRRRREREAGAQRST
ncbi:EamA family transporter [Alsobacter soli]|uniref:EamA family transporter n=1 Tax=Alsobacter soli TaxID=2109933 RepID=A0A2T1HUF2_9HYPH|nr:EamA family transporter [Alsobacter soli]